MARKLSIIEPREIEWVPISSLEKIFMKKEPLTCPILYQMSALQGECVSFQTAYRYRIPYYSSQMMVQATKNPSVTVEVIADSSLSVTVRKVAYVPSTYPAYGENDCDYLTTEPGLFPDPLEKLDGSFQLIPFYWRSLWIDVKTGEETRPGDYTISLVMKNLQGEFLKKISMELHVIGQKLPVQSLVHTEWFHADCLADYYRVPVFSEKHWEIIGNFMKTAANRGINMILVPLFTLPLDTLIGGERTTFQLVDVCEWDDGWTFEFDKLERYIRLAQECGFSYFEMSHLFSQWGAKYAPKIMGFRNGKEERLFGWETKADNQDFLNFYSCFLPALTQKLEEMGIASCTFFHISDEPNAGNIDTFRKAADFVKDYLKGYRILDALSTLQYYKEGIIENPVPTNEFIHEFLDAGLKHPWVYYCSGEFIRVSNRFFAHSSARNRILGIQMYLYRIEGFLHWGYNFYNSQYSRRHINPYMITDAEDAFPSGDSFLVYPGEDGHAVESLRLVVLEEAINDYRALSLLEEKKGREFTEHLIEKYAGMQITFAEYPDNAQFLISLREAVNGELEKC